ncbi:hypothetical protein FPV67DRAFT_1421123, partial [Lyophyllum atratum]
AIEGDLAEDGSFPLYQHPADESPPLLPKSTIISRRYVLPALYDHPVNHILIRHYRSGKDCISEHSDKTIDVVPMSDIVNIDLGAQGLMTPRLKRTHTKEAPAAPSDMGPMKNPAHPPPPPLDARDGPATNTQWLHCTGSHHDNLQVRGGAVSGFLTGGWAGEDFRQGAKGKRSIGWGGERGVDSRIWSGESEAWV